MRTPLETIMLLLVEDLLNGTPLETELLLLLHYLLALLCGIHLRLIAFTLGCDNNSLSYRLFYVQLATINKRASD